MFQYATKVSSALSPGTDVVISYQSAFARGTEIIWKMDNEEEMHFFRLIDSSKGHTITNMVELNAGQLVWGFPIHPSFNGGVEYEIDFSELTAYEAPKAVTSKAKTSPKKKMTISAPASMKKGGGGASGGGGGGGSVLDV